MLQSLEKVGRRASGMLDGLVLIMFVNWYEDTHFNCQSWGESLMGKNPELYKMEKVGKVLSRIRPSAS